ncbi:MAG: hypothetical protein ABJA85_03625 [Bacteroidota bacterium]
MEEKNQQPLDDLKDIKEMMERSSRFISLSGLSGIAAGICALVGLYLVVLKIDCWKIDDCLFPLLRNEGRELEKQLYLIAAGTFAAAFISAFFFTWIRSKKNKVPVWGPVARRLMWNEVVPLVAGAFFLYAMIRLKQYELVAPGCLVFYGLALVNASKYTLSEIRYLGYLEILLGLINCWYTGYGLQFLAVGFGMLHIIYGAIMWWKYERK